MHILITGANSYVGTHVEAWIKAHSDYQVHTLDMMDDAWRQTDFSAYDVVYHVAGMAHVNPSPSMEAFASRRLSSTSTPDKRIHDPSFWAQISTLPFARICRATSFLRPVWI